MKDLSYLSVNVVRSNEKVTVFLLYLKTDLFRQGKLFHSALEDVLTSHATWKDRSPSEYPPEVQGYMQSVSDILEDIRAVRAIESTVQHETLNYLGVVDCVARYR